MRVGTLSGESELCQCGADLCWEDCDRGHTDCYQTVCETPLGCGSVIRDCEEDWL